MPKNWTRTTIAAHVVVAAAALLGCEKSPYELAPARGVVTLNGKPVPTGTVMFSPIAKEDGLNAGAPAFGAIQSDGTFVLTTYQDNDGAIVGEHWVTINNRSTAGTEPTAAATLPFRRIAMPQKVSVVEGQENSFPLSLTSQDVARYGRRD
jgi:hypothetical protein